MVYVAIALSLLFVVLLIAFNVRSSHWRNRRKGERRQVDDRRQSANGRREHNGFDHESDQPDRRHRGDRRIGPETRRHKKRRAEDRLGHD